ncbi:hypothetical protein STVA_41420 [Allostella vacuolata]|nr:hypothetical protein STVA_41420 [Stella vacuolata]
MDRQPADAAAGGRRPGLTLAVAVALHPLDFDEDAFEAGDEGESWTVLGQVYRTNPRRRITEDHREMLSVWRLWRQVAGPFGQGAGHLPDAGGVQDQAAIMLDALEAMSAAEAAIRKERKGGDE